MAVIACGALGASIRQIVARRRWQVELHAPPAAAAQPPPADRARGRAARPAIAVSRPVGRRRLRRLRHLRRARRGVRAPQRRAAPRTSLLRRVRRARDDARAVRRRAGHLRADRLPRAQLPPDRAARARPRSSPRALGRLLRSLPPSRLAGPASGPRRSRPRLAASPSCSAFRSRSSRSAWPRSSASSSELLLRRGRPRP